MKTGILLLLAAGALAARGEELEKELDRVGRAATAMIDGDVCRRIETGRSLEFQLKKDPKDPWVASDNFDVDHQAYDRTKKTLIRLSRLCPAACDVNLWMPLPSDPGKVQVLIRNVYEMSLFWKWGDLNQPAPPEMKKVLATGERITVHGGGGKIAVLAPVYDSLDDIVGLAEVVAQQPRDPQENVK